MGTSGAVASSMMMDSHSILCPCLVVPASTSLPRKQIKSLGSLELSYSFLGPRVMKKGQRGNFKSLKRQQAKKRGTAVVNEFGGQYEDAFEDVKSQIINYFTYKAVMTVLDQLQEMNPPQYHWLYEFIVTNKLRDGKQFICTLMKEKQELAERVMITRLDLYGKWIKKFDHDELYKQISDQNLDVMREWLMETVVWPSDEEMVG